MTLRYKIILGIVAFTVLPLGGAALVVNRTLTRHLEEHAGSDLQRRVAQTASTVTAFVRQREADLRIFASSTVIADGTPAQIGTRLNELALLSFFFDGLYFADPQGRVIAATVPAATGRPLTEIFPDIVDELASLHENASRDVIAGDFDESPLAGALRSQLLTPVLDSAGHRRGVLMGVMSIAGVGQQIINLKEHTVGNGDSDLLTRDGRVLKSTDETVRVLEVDPDWPAVQGAIRATRDGEGFVIYKNARGRKVLAGFATTERFGGAAGQWIVVSTGPYDQIMAPAFSIIRGMMWLLLVFLVVAISAGALAARSLLRPLEGVTEAARQLAAGHATARAPVRGGFELALLASTFNEMAETRQRAEAEGQVISEIVQGVITTSSLDELLDLAHRSIGKLLYAENCFVGLHDAKTDLIHFEFWVDKRDKVPPPQPISNGFTRSSYVLRTGRPLLLTKELEARLFGRGDLAKSGSASASWMAVPLRTLARTIGVLAVQHYEDENAYSQRDLEFLSLVGDQIALAIERKQSEKALCEAEAKYRSIFEHSNDGIFQNTSEGRFLSANPALARILGFDSPEELIRERGDIERQGYANPVMRDKFKQALEENGFISNFEYEVFRKDGAKIWVAESARIVRDAEGRVLYYEGSVQEITERKRAEAELENIHKQLVEASRRGGMAEIATNVLHNVGNVLNSVNVSAGLIVESMRNSKAPSLAKVVVLLREHAHDLGAFITSDPKGKHVPAHLAQLSEHLMADRAAIVSELDSLRGNVEHIKEIVAMQQRYATFGGVKEMINVVNLVEDSMRMNEGALNRHRVEVPREFKDVPLMNVEKNKILQILVNLVRNAKYACDESGRADKRLTVRVANGDGRVKISMIDNGVGILPENLTRIFSHGFTTWKNGHGFGLHSGALAAREMGGSLTVYSEGSGQGAAFTLELPCENN